MNATAAREQLRGGEECKYVAQLVPPLLYIARMSLGSTHGGIALSKGLATASRSFKKPYKLKEPENFNAGRLKVLSDGTVHNTGYSSDFSDGQNAILDNGVLQSLFDSAEIELI